MFNEFEVNVPTEARVKVKAPNLEHAAAMAREFIRACSPTEFFIDGYNQGGEFAAGIAIVSASIDIAGREVSVLDEGDGNNSQARCEPDPETEPEKWKEYKGLVPGGSNDASRYLGRNGEVLADWNEQERLAVVKARRKKRLS